jgi:hypothetical protein
MSYSLNHSEPDATSIAPNGWRAFSSGVIELGEITTAHTGEESYQPAPVANQSAQAISNRSGLMVCGSAGIPPPRVRAAMAEASPKGAIK